ncbi:MICOS complex subunit MIC19 [Bagarius yarrelli]|uniref:MICOS complex subunit MIC19 n=1 Tax=Bagarius yarrelli TaxID=175774 RepID=A0A556VB43_BAGYA|nr:MICOS complex subunit MIC19 [Bagarius yarrelli]
MGGSNSTRRVSFESDENDDVTVVKGIRLSENVINRMREPSKPPVRASEPVAPSPAPPKPSPAAPSGFAVDDAELRRKISEEVQRGLEEERNRTHYELHRWLEKERARLKAQARSDAQAQVQNEVNRILALEKAAALDSAQQAVLRERVNAEDEQLRIKRLAKQLEERDQQLKKQDAFYREQLNKLEERHSSACGFLLCTAFKVLLLNNVCRSNVAPIRSPPCPNSHPSVISPRLLLWSVKDNTLCRLPQRLIQHPRYRASKNTGSCC